MKSLLALFVLASSALAGTNDWQWQPSRLPRARVFEGMWSDDFQIVPALHSAGLQYTCISLNELPAHDADLSKDSVIVIVNCATPNLKPARLARIKEFVANGGGLVVLAGRSAYSQGKYDGTPLEEMLPVTFLPRSGIPHYPAGIPLTRATSATWLPALDLGAKPMAYSVQAFTPKPDAVVQLLVGDKPAIVSGTYGKGRVVAVALTVNGNPPAGAIGFWDWPEWPRLLGQSIDWAAGARPQPTPSQLTTTVLKPLTTDELNDFALGLKTPDNLLARAVANPNAAVAEAIFTQLTTPDATGKLTLPQALPVLLPFAKPDWGPRLAERSESLNPNREDRAAALTLLGATRWPNAFARLVPELSKDETQLAAIAGLGYTGDARAIGPLRKAYDNAVRAALVPGETEYFQPDPLAREYGALMAESALALYRLGDTNGLERVLHTNRRIKLYWRIFVLASRRELRNWNDPIALAALRNICDLASRLQMYAWDKLRKHGEPIPASQLPAFLKAAQTATDPADVQWFVGEMEASLAAYPPATWQPLTTAKDGIIARLAKAAVAK